MSAMDLGAVSASHDSEEPIMQTVTTIGLDIAKSVFQVHGAASTPCGHETGRAFS